MENMEVTESIVTSITKQTGEPAEIVLGSFATISIRWKIMSNQEKTEIARMIGGYNGHARTLMILQEVFGKSMV